MAQPAKNYINQIANDLNNKFLSKRFKALIWTVTFTSAAAAAPTDPHFTAKLLMQRSAANVVNKY